MTEANSACATSRSVMVRPSSASDAMPLACSSSALSMSLRKLTASTTVTMLSM
eukprot:CAMPEP_0173227140 /NCGR_PEP_ID=MMETSP1142-20121109/5805_1 /TAXON_ID=483371 /ORGANISM="non described non described, Strain CCMP2298" /LENGTH=52 /DNA_ID=CAMNT_0014155637 /DNA_START=1552 /DNA_END=1710 /DNA_ORIENTATION=+